MGSGLWAMGSGSDLGGGLGYLLFAACLSVGWGERRGMGKVRWGRCEGEGGEVGGGGWVRRGDVTAGGAVKCSFGG